MAKKAASNVYKAFAARMKKTGAWDRHKGDEATVPGARLPAGISNGVAQLSTIEIDVYGDDARDKSAVGKPFFRAVGICQEPETHDNQRTQGLQTSVREDLFETKFPSGDTISEDEHVSRMLNTLKLLGAPIDDDSDPDEVQDVFEALRESKPYFGFRTYSRRGSDFVNHVWTGEIEDYQPSEADEIEDNTEEVEDESEEEEPEETEDEPEEDEGETENDYSALGASADEGDEEAEAELIELCEEAGIDPDEYETWTEAAEALGGGGDGGDEFIPKKGAVCAFYATEKTKRPKMVRIVGVNETTKTATIKVGNKTVKEPWSKFKAE